MTFNAQAVKMNRYCYDYDDVSESYYVYTPATDKGHSYVVNLFKSSSDPVKLIFDGEVLYVPVTGFSEAWNNAGGEAI